MKFSYSNIWANLPSSIVDETYGQKKGMLQ